MSPGLTKPRSHPQGGRTVAEAERSRPDAEASSEIPRWPLALLEWSGGPALGVGHLTVSGPHKPPLVSRVWQKLSTPVEI